MRRESDFPAFRETLSRSIVTVFLLTIPSSVGLWLLGESMIGIVYQHGHFLSFDTHQTSVALSFYAPGLAGYAAVKLLAPAFYALGDARTPMLVSLVSVLVNAVSAFTLVHGFPGFAGLGYAGLALSLSLVSTFNALLLVVFIRPRHRRHQRPRDCASVSPASSVRPLLWGRWYMALTVASHAAVSSIRLSRIVDVVIGVPVRRSRLLSAASALGIAEIAEARDAVLRRFRRNR